MCPWRLALGAGGRPEMDRGGLENRELQFKMRGKLARRLVKSWHSGSPSTKATTEATEKLQLRHGSCR